MPFLFRKQGFRLLDSGANLTDTLQHQAWALGRINVGGRSSRSVAENCSLRRVVADKIPTVMHDISGAATTTLAVVLRILTIEVTMRYGHCSELKQL